MYAPYEVYALSGWKCYSRSYYAPGVDSASNRNEYQLYFLGVKAVGVWGWPYHHSVPLSWNRGTLTSWNPLGHSRPVTGLFYQVYFLGVEAVGVWGWPYHHPVPLSWNRGTLTSWNPLGHSRPVTGLSYLYLYLNVTGRGTTELSWAGGG
jgi:hypothetical protein